MIADASEAATRSLSAHIKRFCVKIFYRQSAVMLNGYVGKKFRQTVLFYKHCAVACVRTYYIHGKFGSKLFMQVVFALVFRKHFRTFKFAYIVIVRRRPCKFAYSYIYNKYGFKASFRRQ